MRRPETELINKRPVLGSLRRCSRRRAHWSRRCSRGDIHGLRRHVRGGILVRLAKRLMTIVPECVLSALPPLMLLPPSPGNLVGIRGNIAWRIGIRRSVIGLTVIALRPPRRPGVIIGRVIEATVGASRVAVG